MKRIFLLSGEGAKGAEQAYILKRLAEENIRPDMLMGISSGAINACGYSLVGAHELCVFWEGIKSINDIFSFNPWFMWQNGLYRTKPIEKKLSKLQEEYFSYPVYFWATDKRDSRPKSFYYGKKASFTWQKQQELLSAISIPGLVNSESGFCDAGGSLLAPLNEALKLSPEEIYIILGRNIFQTKKAPKDGFLGPIKQAYHFFDVIMESFLLNNLKSLSRVGSELLDFGVDKMSAKKSISVKLCMPSTQTLGALDFIECKAMAKGMYGMTIIEDFVMLNN